jgi:hypothetical protein
MALANHERLKQKWRPCKSAWRGRNGAAGSSALAKFCPAASLRRGAGFRMRNRASDLGRPLVLSETLIDDLAQQIVVCLRLSLPNPLRVSRRTSAAIEARMRLAALGRMPFNDLTR